jgi:hypothetical protein
MGRKKIEIKYIENQSRKRSAYNQRKNGLIKKAMELNILTGSKICICIQREDGSVIQYNSNADFDSSVVSSIKPTTFYTNANYDELSIKKISKKKESKKMSQPTVNNNFMKKTQEKMEKEKTTKAPDDLNFGLDDQYQEIPDLFAVDLDERYQEMSDFFNTDLDDQHQETPGIKLDNKNQDIHERFSINLDQHQETPYVFLELDSHIGSEEETLKESLDALKSIVNDH